VSKFVHGGGPGVDGGPSVVCRWIVDKKVGSGMMEPN